MKILTKWLTAAFLALSATGGAVAQDRTPYELVSAAADQIMTFLQEQNERVRDDPQFVRQKLNEIVFPLIDFEDVSRLILGHYWREATPEQRTRFVEVFRDNLVETYTESVAEYAGTKVKVTPPRGEPVEPVTVYTTIIPEGKPAIPVDFKFRLDEGRWEAYDLIIDGLSMVTNYRTSFTREISETSLDALIKRLAGGDEQKETSESNAQ